MVGKLYKCFEGAVCYVLIYIVADIAFELTNVAVPYCYGLIIDQTIRQNINSVGLGLALLAICLVSVTIATAIKNYMCIVIRRLVVYRLRNRVMGNAIAHCDEFERGVYVSKMEDIEKIVGFVTGVLCTSVAATLSFLVMVYMSFRISKVLTLIELCLVPVHALFAYRYGKRVQIWEKGVITQRDRMFSYLFEALDGIKEFKALGIGRTVADKFSERNKAYIYSEKIRDSQSLRWTQLFSLFLGMSQIVVLVVSCGLIFKGKITIGEYYIYNSYSARLNNFGVTFVSWCTHFSSISMALNHISDELERSIDLEQGYCNDKINNIIVEDVGFKYDEKSILENVNLFLQSSSIVVIRGGNGVGKTTLMHLMANIKQPTCGRIRINDDKMNPNIRYRIAYFGANVFLFNDSVINNIKIANQQISNNQVFDVCRKLGIDRFICQLPDGYQTVIGEKGERLSRGQVQGIALARAFCVNADVYLFDEATSYLDESISERFVSMLEALKMEGKIIVVATHEGLDNMKVDGTISLKASTV